MAGLRRLGATGSSALGTTQPHEAEAILACGPMAEDEIAKGGPQGRAAQAEEVRLRGRWAVQLELLRWFLRCRGMHPATSRRSLVAAEVEAKASPSAAESS